MNEEQAKAYLSAMIDGEGCVSPRDFRVRIGNTEMSIVEAIEECCDILGIEYKRHENGPRPGSFGTKTVYEILISRRYNLEILQKAVSLRSESKREKLDQMMDSYKPGYGWTRKEVMS